MGSTDDGQRRGSTTLRFLAAPTDVADLGGTAVSGGRVLEWVDRAAYACAAAWSSGYCVTAYVGDVAFEKPINTGELVEVRAHLILTGRSSMHVRVVVSAGPVQTGELDERATCIVIFIALDAKGGRPTQVREWEPRSQEQHREAGAARDRIGVRSAIEREMADQTYSGAGTAPRAVLRFLAAPTDVNWGGKTHGGTVMRWIDEAAGVCAMQWTGERCLAVYSGGIRFYRPIPIGNLVEVSARLLHTGRSSMHIAVHVRTADPMGGELELTTHCLTVFVAVRDGGSVPVPQWEPASEEDQHLDRHALQLTALRGGERGGPMAAPQHDGSPSSSG
ncbi:MAG TPA: hotdog domain-containing protein [Ornithinimicrobium sp.]|uniref:acyl-CoA thioesterase n=1 Tax=Ornithinimicrobium sp. TaxID=1977084 RepID=UPI002B48F321|nr:hotdog domain-containing protein [Ornithinimicrobium sp.]HKJ10798.1 hotdog domain-containing protein [Ornithinimicrobium sp.]